MLNWRFCLQILLFILIVFWAGICIKLSYDVLKKHPGEHRKGTDRTELGQQLYPYDLMGGRASALRQRNALLRREGVFDNGYSSRLVDLVYRTAMKSTNDRRRQVEFEQSVAAARQIIELAGAAADAERMARIRLVSGEDSVPINAQGAIDAAELVAADDYNLAHYTRQKSKKS
ncbi:uncharacterized protein [Drosophila virilis]|uniref:uncharacterized protein n=1 Tax=Drosophila virilis TaxID=7244 RepID=UPI0013965BD8|nr:uncharacterized protein LOC116652142 isoform X1 [Drosophila virilis]